MDGISTWHIDVPASMYRVAVDPPPECTSMTHLRGELHPGAPVMGVVSTQPRPGASAAAKAGALAAGFVEPVEPTAVQVDGSRRAARVDGLIDLGEGLTADGIERLSVVVAEMRSDFVILTIRTRPDDDVADAVEEVLGSFRVREPSAT